VGECRCPFPIAGDCIVAASYCLVAVKSNAQAIITPMIEKLYDTVPLMDPSALIVAVSDM
jgi:hypothetical protein